MCKKMTPGLSVARQEEVPATAASRKVAVLLLSSVVVAEFLIFFKSIR